MNKHIKLSKQSKKLLFSGITAAALALVVGGPHAVKADSVSGSTLAAQSLNNKANLTASKAPDKNAIATDKTVVHINKSFLDKSNTTSNSIATKSVKAQDDDDEPIDSWMPDKNLQKVVAYNLYSDDSEAGVKRITKADLGKLKELYLFGEHEQNDMNYYIAGLSIQSLKGLEYAHNLERLELEPDIDTNINDFGVALIHSNLSDISALKDLDKLESVNLQQCSIYDISALANKPKLTNLSISYNAITDFSPLKSDTAINSYTPAYYQAVQYQTLSIPQSYGKVSLSYNCYDKDGSNMKIRVADTDDIQHDHYVRNYLSNWKKDAGVVSSDGKTVTWDFSGLPVGYRGYMTVNYKGAFFGQAGYESGGWIIIPFEITNN